MDYDAVICRLGKFGRFQKRLLTLLLVPPFLDAITTSIIVFIVGNQSHRCQNPDIPGDFYSNANYSSTTNVSECFIITNGSRRSCEQWVYDTRDMSSTIMSTFDLVCDKEFVRSHILLCHHLGVFIGSLTYGLICDTLGRRPVLSSALIFMFLCNLGRSWSNNVILIGFLMLGNGWFGVTLYASTFILATELVEPSKRLFTSFVMYTSFCIGELAVFVLAYFIRDWRYLGTATSVPIGLGHIVLFFIVESPRWLLAKGKVKKATLILKNIAKENSAAFDIDVNEIRFLNTEDVEFCKTVKQILQSKTLSFRGAILAFNWFVVNLTYYGISFKVGNLGGSIHINFLISTIAELLAMFICLFFNKWAGRTRTFTVAICVCGLACLCTIFTSLYASQDYHWITIGLAMIGKLFISVGFFNIYLMTAEMFPTVLRSTVLGTCSAIGRIGSMISAYVGELGIIIDTQFGIALPLIIFGAFAITSGLISLFLPDTDNINLPQSVEDATSLKRKRDVVEVNDEDDID